MRIAKWIGLALLGLVLLLVAGAWLVTRFVDPQRFKPQIAAAVRDATGRELQLRGPLALSWFPSLALEASNGTLDGDDANAPLASWRSLRVGTKLLPLIDGQLNLDRVQIDGLVVRLRRDAAGVGNWQSLLDKLRAPGGDSSYSLRQVAGIALNDASIEYRAADGQATRVQHLSLETGDIAPGKPIGFRAGFDLLQAGSDAVTTIGIDTVASLQGDELALRKLEASASWGGGPTPRRVSLTADVLKGNLARQLWELPTATLALGTAALQLNGASLSLGETAKTGSARFTLAPTSLRTLLANAGINAPTTRDANALARFAASGSVDFSGAGLRLQLDTLQLDDTRFSGQLVALTPADVAEFSLAGDAMNLDRYRGPENEPGEPFVFPTEKLAALRARGTLTLQQASAMGADLRGVTLRLLFADGRLQGDPAAQPAPKPVRAAKTVPAR